MNTQQRPEPCRFCRGRGSEAPGWSGSGSALNEQRNYEVAV